MDLISGLQLVVDMFRSRDIAAAFGVVLVGFILLGAVAGAFTQTPPLLGAMAYAVTVLTLVFIPLVRSTRRWPALGLGTSGILHFVPALYAVSIGLPFAATSAVHLILSIIVITFSFLAYHEARL